jgi:hypothetical protein
MSDDYVWVCQALGDTTVTSGVMFNDIRKNDKEHAIAIREKIRKGESLSSENFPQKIWGTPPATRRKYDFDLFHADGYWGVSAKAAEVLRRFDLGGGGLFPVELFKAKGVECDDANPISGEWYCWNFGNMKQSFIPEQSGKLFRAGEGKWDLSSQAEDFSVKLARSEGPDVWIDPALPRALFFSKDLGQALVDAGLANKKSGFGKLIKCALVDA